MNVGAVVVRAGWAYHPEYQYLARRGRVLDVRGSQATVEWQAGCDGKIKTETLSINALHQLHWRSTIPTL